MVTTVDALQSRAAGLVTEVTPAAVKATRASAIDCTVADTVAQLFTVEAMVAGLTLADVICHRPM